MVYLSVPDDYGCQLTLGQPRTSPRQQGRPPAKAKLTFRSVSSYGRERGEKRGKSGGRGYEKRLETIKHTAYRTNRSNVRGEQAKVNGKNGRPENRLDLKKRIFQHTHAHTTIRVVSAQPSAIALFYTSLYHIRINSSHFLSVAAYKSVDFMSHGRLHWKQQGSAKNKYYSFFIPVSSCSGWWLEEFLIN